MTGAGTLVLVLILVSVTGVKDILAETGHTGSVGLEERLGNTVPADLGFRDEKGNGVIIKELLNRPTVLMLTYFTCSHICPQMLGSFAVAISTLPLEPGKDYRVITLSFDETDTLREAQSLKVNYLKAIGKPFPEDAWKFLTGDRENIRRLSEALGITVKRTDHGFAHPEVLVFIAPGGKITRYLPVSKYRYGAAYPISFSEVDLAAGIRDASQGKVSLAARKEPLYCFLHEPEHQKLFFDILKISGAVTLSLMLALFIVLRKRRKTSPERSDLSGT